MDGQPMIEALALLAGCGVGLLILWAMRSVEIDEVPPREALSLVLLSQKSGALVTACVPDLDTEIDE